MEFTCPHCGEEYRVPDPFDALGDFDCVCGKKFWVECDEGEEGPSFAVYKEMPSSQLFPPKGGET